MQVFGCHFLHRKIGIIFLVSLSLLFGGGRVLQKFFYLQLALLCSQLRFFAYSSLRCLLDALSRCKQLQNTTVSKKLHWKQEASDCEQKATSYFALRFLMVVETPSADCKRGRRKGATSKNVKNRQEVSKSFSTLFDNFRAGQKTSKTVKKLKKRQKVFRHFSTIFAQHHFSVPFWGALIPNCHYVIVFRQIDIGSSLRSIAASSSARGWHLAEGVPWADEDSAFGGGYWVGKVERKETRPAWAAFKKRTNGANCRQKVDIHSPTFVLRKPPPATEPFRALRARNPKRVKNESKKSLLGTPVPRGQQVRKESKKESETSQPKGPCRTKNTTESEFRYGEYIRYGRSKTLRRGLRSACFLGKRGRKTVRILKNYGGGKTVRIRAPYYF